MYVIRDEIYSAMVEDAQRRYPVECCGVVAGKTRPEVVTPMENELSSPTRFELNREEQLRVWWEIEQRGERIFILYHSHTAGKRAEPSRADIAFGVMAGKDVLHMILSINPDKSVREAVLWRYRAGERTNQVVAEEVTYAIEVARQERNKTNQGSFRDGGEGLLDLDGQGL